MSKNLPIGDVEVQKGEARVKILDQDSNIEFWHALAFEEGQHGHLVLIYIRYQPSLEKFNALLLLTPALLI